MLSLRLQTTMHRKKSLFNVFLILLGQHYTIKNPMQCCPWGSRQQRMGNNPVQCCFNTLGTRLHRSKFYPMLSEGFRDNTARKNPAQFCLNTLGGTTLHRKNPMQYCPRGSRQHCTRKKPGNIGWITSGRSVPCNVGLLCNVSPRTSLCNLGTNYAMLTP